MKNHGENPAKNGITSEELESLLHQVLREDGKVFPVSEEDIRNLEVEIDPNEVQNIDPARLLARVRNQKSEERSKVVSLFGKTSPEVENDLIAMAARNGGQITDEVRKQMEKDRANAEKGLTDEK
jgi:inorganic pyrophosphatase/exopolyphosphatase